MRVARRELGLKGPPRNLTPSIIVAVDDRGHVPYVKGDVVILTEPLSVPDGTEVEIFIPSAKAERSKKQAKLRIAQETFGMMRADPALVRAVLEEDLYDA